MCLTYHVEVVYVVAKRPVKLTPKWLKMSEVYRYFAQPWSHLCDFSESAAQEMFLFESRGIPYPKKEKLNGFALGKHWMDVTHKMWLEDLSAGLLFKSELYADPNLPDWWLDQVLP